MREKERKKSGKKIKTLYVDAKDNRESIFVAIGNTAQVEQHVLPHHLVLVLQKGKKKNALFDTQNNFLHVRNISYRYPSLQERLHMVVEDEKQRKLAYQSGFLVYDSFTTYATSLLREPPEKSKARQWIDNVRHYTQGLFLNEKKKEHMIERANITAALRRPFELRGEEGISPEEWKKIKSEASTALRSVWNQIRDHRIVNILSRVHTFCKTLEETFPEMHIQTQKEIILFGLLYSAADAMEDSGKDFLPKETMPEHDVLEQISPTGKIPGKKKVYSGGERIVLRDVREYPSVKALTTASEMLRILERYSIQIPDENKIDQSSVKNELPYAVHFARYKMKQEKK